MGAHINHLSILSALSLAMRWRTFASRSRCSFCLRADSLIRCTLWKFISGWGRVAATSAAAWKWRDVARVRDL